jgi:hypothetical protein
MSIPYDFFERYTIIVNSTLHNMQQVLIRNSLWWSWWIIIQIVQPNSSSLLVAVNTSFCRHIPTKAKRMNKIIYLSKVQCVVIKKLQNAGVIKSPISVMLISIIEIKISWWIIIQIVQPNSSSLLVAVNTSFCRHIQWPPFYIQHSLLRECHLPFMSRELALSKSNVIMSINKVSVTIPVLELHTCFRSFLSKEHMTGDVVLNLPD